MAQNNLAKIFDNQKKTVRNWYNIKVDVDLELNCA